MKIFTMSLAMAICASIIYFTVIDQPRLEWLHEMTKTIEFKIFICILCVAAIIPLVRVIVSRIQENMAKLDRPQEDQEIVNKQYAVRRSAAEYETEAKVYTEKCLKELMKSEAYKKMMQEKGQDQMKWNWQTRESVHGEEAGEKEDAEDE